MSLGLEQNIIQQQLQRSMLRSMPQPNLTIGPESEDLLCSTQLSLPVELLIDAFLFLPIRARMNAGIVCKQWHEVMFSSPKIWSIIRYSQVPSGHYALTPDETIMGVRTPRALSHTLELSRLVPLSLRLVAAAEDAWEEIYDMLQPHLSRVTDIQIFIDFDHSVPEKASLTRLMSSAAPLLRVACIIDTVGDNFHDTLRLFDDHAPKLEDLVIKANLSVLQGSNGSLNCVKRAAGIDLDVVNGDDIATIFQLFKSAIELTISVHEWDRFDSASVARRVVPPMALQNLIIKSYGTVQVAECVLSTIHWQDIPCVSVARRSQDDETDCYSIFALLIESPASPMAGLQQPFITKTAVLDWYGDIPKPNYEIGPVVHAYSVDREMVIRVPTRLDVHSHPSEWIASAREFINLPTQPPDGLFSNLTRLYVRELFFFPNVYVHALPPIPSLLDLTVWIMSRYQHQSDCGLSPFSESPETSDATNLTCPLLQRLVIAASWSDWNLVARPVLSAGMVNGFIRTCLAYDSAKLENLELLGIDLHITDPKDFTDMMESAEKTAVDPRLALWRANWQEPNRATWQSWC
ncbi:hypothetical protein BKA62DRAFT_718172 [Auriculariales sp. MPI-PUGE-AT-0066]|nr:hypothetical protein BKA62DRAFT_718172 [Auriculariales sp. MPI-PUGE-AT-0066]